jgi:ATP-dependent phosphofructokinase / diphosphate-dependent phosphofructokinase
MSRPSTLSNEPLQTKFKEEALKGSMTIKRKRIAILTGGGDCPGLNAVIRAAAKKAILEKEMEVIGIEDGYHGIVNNRWRTLDYNDVSGILTLGGTILGTSKTANPYRYGVRKGNRLEFHNLSKLAIQNIMKLDLTCLICIGGDGTLGIAYRLFKDGIPIIGLPKTIDNDLREPLIIPNLSLPRKRESSNVISLWIPAFAGMTFLEVPLRGTDITFGFNSAVSIATEGIDRVHNTAESLHLIMIVEVMGHMAGWIALFSGVAGGGDIILIPEIPYDIQAIAEKVKERDKKGKRFSMVVIAEGAKPRGGDIAIQRIVKESPDRIRIGGIGFVLGEQIEKMTHLETRTVVMGHLLRGGSPTPFDRILATQLGIKAVELIEDRKFGHMVGVKGNSFVTVPLEEVAKGPKLIPFNHPMIKAARSLGTCLGD